VMKLNISVVPPSMSSLPRSCARCGSGFHATKREYICPACRKPKGRIHKQGPGQLSFREKQIVTLIRQAKANKEIAFELCLSEGTVKEYLYRIFRKQNVTSRTELAVRSYQETLAPGTQAWKNFFARSTAPAA
jgi:DNA-binding NarL/FixJ family response regulator